MLGNSLSSFAIFLMIRRPPRSTLLYALYIAMYTLPQIIVPIFSGALLDRFSRKRTIYTLDFISGGLFLLVAIILHQGLFSYALFAIFTFLLGCIQSIYTVAYQSFYPLLITEGNFQKAYSIDSVLETLTNIMVPVSAIVYRFFGVVPLFLIDTASFIFAAIMEMQITADEKYIETQKENRAENISHTKQMLLDTREGFAYLKSEKGLLMIAIYFFFTAITTGSNSVLVLPWFRGAFNNGEFIYMLVGGMMVLGRSIGGGIHYKTVIPEKKRYTVAMAVYITINIIGAVYLYLPIPAMMALCFIDGIGGVSSYTIRISATQSYVPDEKKGRFNGAFNMLWTVGMLAGEGLAGGLSVILPDRAIISIVMTMCLIAAFVFIGGGKKHVEAIYNRAK
jgi:MFS family permease